jgi:hypothetical protein
VSRYVFMTWCSSHLNADVPSEKRLHVPTLRGAVHNNAVTTDRVMYGLSPPLAALLDALALHSL